MAEGPVAALSEHPGGDFGSTGGKRGPLCFVSPLRAGSDIHRTSAERFPLSQINGANRRAR
jgi:hypothetical protein